MKHIFTLLSFLLILNTAHAQAPQGIPYQAAARNSSGAVIASTAISVRFTIRDSVTTGAIKYRETHSTTTDANGMFSVNVGQGTPVSGTFAGINWGTNAKFMQVELDPAGGSSYIDMGTQQMMSVPYSLFSNNGFPSGLGGDIMYHNGTNWVKLPAGMTGQVLTMGSTGFPVWSGCALPSAGTITGIANVSAAGCPTTLSNTTTGGSWSSNNTSIATVSTGGIVNGIAAGTATISYTITNTCGSAVATRIVTVSATTISVGTSYGGGIIAYILLPGDPGYASGQTRGLIAAPSDQSTGTQWGCHGTVIGGTSFALGTGAANTSTVISVCTTTGIAARLCADLVLGGFSDWYLPSRDELYKMHINKSCIGGFSSGFYWSSSEGAANSAWGIFFSNGLIDPNNKYPSYYVRAVRSFSCPETPSSITGTGTVCAGSTTTLSNATTGGTWSSSDAGIATVGSTGVVSGVSAGTATISYTVTESCGSATATTVVTVNPLPSAGTITGTATVSAGSTTTLSNTTTGGTWSSSNAATATVGTGGIVSGIAEGTATISYTVTNTCGSTIATQVVTVTPFVFALYASYGGGKIAYILQLGDPGYVAGQTNGLIAAPNDQSTGIMWWNGSNISTGATGTAVGTGMSNTNAIVAAQGAGSYAASICANLVLGGYNDWYLPSRGELGKLYSHRMGIGGFSGFTYWSSSENDFELAWITYFSNGILGSSLKNSNISHVRAIRSFSCPETPSAITGTVTVCAGSTTVLSSVTTGGTWSSSTAGIATVGSTGVVSGVSAGTATISYTVTESCGSATTTHVVTVNPLPSAGTITGTATVTVGSITTFSNATTGGLWSSSATAIATVGTAGIVSGMVSGIAAGTAIISYTVTNSCGSTVATRVVTVTPALAVGDTYGGGTIAYILLPDDPGYTIGEIHGLVAAPSDQSTGIVWYNGSYIPTGATGTAIGTGMTNTNAIVLAQGEGLYAARLCADLVLGGYSDWYLPSKDELNKIYANRIAIGGFTSADYWSSSEYHSYDAWYIWFGSGSPVNYAKFAALYVRAIRSF